jgi:hypothetical protein
MSVEEGVRTAVEVRTWLGLAGMVALEAVDDERQD